MNSNVNIQTHKLKEDWYNVTMINSCHLVVNHLTENIFDKVMAALAAEVLKILHIYI